MTSPVDTSVKWARSTMPGAPVLTRAAGSLISLIDALCVDGWGLQTASSVVVAGGIATASFPTDHAAAPHAVVLVAGITGALAGMNGEQKVTAVKANQIRWATAEVDGIAAGTITVKMAAAGWNKPFSGTNLAVYKSASPQAHGQSLRLNDLAQTARVVGYENMTAVGTGTGLFPSSAQLSGGFYWGKTAMTSGTLPVAWAFASDGRFIYLFTLVMASDYDFNAGAAFAMLFGDLVPEAASGDPFATLVSGANTSAVASAGADYMFDFQIGDTFCAVPRKAGGGGASSRGVVTSASTNVYGTPVYPDAATGGVLAMPSFYSDVAGTGFGRARLPGVARSEGTNFENLGVPKFGILGGHGPHRAHMYVPSAQDATSNTALRGVLLDITGPWR